MGHFIFRSYSIENSRISAGMFGKRLYYQKNTHTYMLNTDDNVQDTLFILLSGKTRGCGDIWSDIWKDKRIWGYMVGKKKIPAASKIR